MNTQNLDGITSKVLDQVDQAEKRRKAMVAALSAVEGILLTTYFVLMDFGDQLHWLILVAALLCYGTIMVGLMVAGAHIDVSTQKLLRAIGLLQNKTAK